MVESSSNTSREGGSRFFSLLLTRRGRVEEKRWGAGPTSLVKLAVGFFSLLFHLCVASRRAHWWLEDSATTGLSWRKQQLVLLFLRKLQNLHAHDYVTHAMTITRTGLRAVGGDTDESHTITAKIPVTP